MKSTLRLFAHHCLRCGYDWAGRLEHPKTCPSCKTYLWHKPKVKGVKADVGDEPSGSVERVVETAS